MKLVIFQNGIKFHKIGVNNYEIPNRKTIKPSE